MDKIKLYVAPAAGAYLGVRFIGGLAAGKGALAQAAAGIAGAAVGLYVVKAIIK